MAALMTDYPTFRAASSAPPPPGAVGGNASAAANTPAPNLPALSVAGGATDAPAFGAAPNWIAPTIKAIGSFLGQSSQPTPAAAAAAPASAALAAPAAPVTQQKAPALTPMQSAPSTITPAPTYNPPDVIQGGMRTATGLGGSAQDIAGQLTQAGLKAQGQGADPLASYFAQLPRFETAAMMGEFSKARGINATPEANVVDLIHQKMAILDAASVKAANGDETKLSQMRNANIAAAQKEFEHLANIAKLGYDPNQGIGVGSGGP